MPANALLNPAAVYCEALGYNYTIQSTEHGERGLCQLPNGDVVDAWEFLQGKVAQNYSYCCQKGYEIKTVKDSKKCLKFLTDWCAVCVLEDGTEVEVTELMNLSFEETVCGDGTCGISENFNTCPRDCPSGGMDTVMAFQTAYAILIAHPAWILIVCLELKSLGHYSKCWSL